MMDLAAKWAAKKVVVIVVSVLAFCGVFFTPVAMYQAVQINGYQVLWWGAPGLKAQLKAATEANGTLYRSNTALSKGVGDCNASIEAAATAGAKQGAEAQRAADAKQASVDAAQREQGRLFAIKPGANALVTAQSVALTGNEP